MRSGMIGNYRRRISLAAMIGMTAITPMGLTGCPCSCTEGLPTDSPTSSYRAQAVAVADFDSDGVDDLAVTAFRSTSTASATGGFVAVLLQDRNSRGTFRSAFETTTRVAPRALAAADIDNTTGADLILAGTEAGEDNLIAMLQTSTASGPLTAPTSLRTSIGSGADVDAIDLNGDDHVDLLVADDAANGRIVVLLHSGVGTTYLAPVSLAVDARVTGLSAGDMNLDGRVDLVVTGSESDTGRLSLFFGTANSTQPFLPRVDLAITTDPRAVALADLDGNGSVDIVLAHDRGQGVTVMLQNNAQLGTFATPVFYSSASRANAIAVADLDADGRLDIATANRLTSNVSVLMQSSAAIGTFDTPKHYLLADAPNDIAVGDFNGDAWPDLALAAGDRAMLMMNTPAAPGTFAAPVQVGR